MHQFELTNEQRRYFGLSEVLSHWQKVALNSENFIYFDGEVIKKHILSNSGVYQENEYDELTINKEFLVSKRTNKRVKLSVSTLSRKSPKGMYVRIYENNLIIANYTTQMTFYSGRDNENRGNFARIVDNFIQNVPKDYFTKLDEFKAKKRVNVKYKNGDYFAFKLDLEHYGFGRILLDVRKLQKKGILADNHNIFHYMGKPVFVELFIHQSKKAYEDIDILLSKKRMPVDIMADNRLFYGEYEIFANREIKDFEYDFPIDFAYGPAWGAYLQWGLVQINLSYDEFIKRLDRRYINDILRIDFSGIGFEPHYIDYVKDALKNGFSYDICSCETSKEDLRNPKNAKIKSELFRVFGLDENKSYTQTLKELNLPLMSEINK